MKLALATKSRVTRDSHTTFSLSEKYVLFVYVTILIWTGITSVLRIPYRHSCNNVQQTKAGARGMGGGRGAPARALLRPFIRPSVRSELVWFGIAVAASQEVP